MKFTKNSVFNVFYCGFMLSKDGDDSLPIGKESWFTSVFFHPEKEKALNLGWKTKLINHRLRGIMITTK